MIVAGGEAFSQRNRNALESEFFRQLFRDGNISGFIQLAAVNVRIFRLYSENVLCGL